MRRKHPKFCQIYCILTWIYCLIAYCLGAQVPPEEIIGAYVLLTMAAVVPMKGVYSESELFSIGFWRLLPNYGVSFVLVFFVCIARSGHGPLGNLQEKDWPIVPSVVAAIVYFSYCRPASYILQRETGKAL